MFFLNYQNTSFYKREQKNPELCVWWMPGVSSYNYLSNLFKIRPISNIGSIANSTGEICSDYTYKARNKVQNTIMKHTDKE